MDETELALTFDAQRSRLRAVAYRILGSLSESDDAVQETWLRLQRTDPATIENLSAWLTTVIARISLVAVLAPDVVLRHHRRDGAPFVLNGAQHVARGALMAREFAPFVRPALINGTAGVIAFDGDRPFAILAFTVIDDRAHAIDVFRDPELVPRLLRSGAA